ncbi:hypothetical protein CYD26_22140 [Pseudomonas sp. FFUP_PS_473]|nr:hypothetical protein CYD26_22140 [Pseudomonas sp. FFUP_PS_473]
MPGYGGCAHEGFGPAGCLLSRSTNLRMAATLRSSPCLIAPWALGFPFAENQRTGLVARANESYSSSFFEYRRLGVRIVVLWRLCAGGLWPCRVCLSSRSTNLRTAATQFRLVANWGSVTTKGASL